MADNKDFGSASRHGQFVVYASLVAIYAQKHSRAQRTTNKRATLSVE